MPIIKVVNERPTTLAEMKQRLDEISKRDGELNHRSKKLKEYLDQFATLKYSDVEKKGEKIAKLGISRLKEKHITKILDICPKDLESLKMILSSDTITLKPEEMNSILEVLKE